MRKLVSEESTRYRRRALHVRLARRFIGADVGRAWRAATAYFADAGRYFTTARWSRRRPPRTPPARRLGRARLRLPRAKHLMTPFGERHDAHAPMFIMRERGKSAINATSMIEDTPPAFDTDCYLITGLVIPSYRVSTDDFLLSRRGHIPPSAWRRRAAALIAPFACASSICSSMAFRADAALIIV